jgi:alanine dehydrogenase
MAYDDSSKPFILTNLPSLRLLMASRSIVFVFVNDDRESKKVRRLVEREVPSAKLIAVQTHDEDVPRLVTEERVFSGYKEIEEYCRAWAPLIQK